MTVDVQVPTAALRIIEQLTGKNGPDAIEQFVTDCVLNGLNPQEEIEDLLEK